MSLSAYVRPEPWVATRWSGEPRAMCVARRDAAEPLGGKAPEGKLRRAGAGMHTSRGAGANQCKRQLAEARECFWKTLLSVVRSDVTIKRGD